MAKIVDKYAQFLKMSVTMSAVDTLTFSQLNIGLSMFDYAGLLIRRIEYSLARASYYEVGTETDVAWLAITGSDQLTSLALSQPQVYDLLEIFGATSGTPATFNALQTPVVKDFVGLPGGGMLVPAQNIYLAMSTSGFVAEGSATARVWYTVEKLSAADYLELAQGLNVLST